MFVYYSNMRLKDDQKKEAIIDAIVQLVNEIGFANISMSKIAKRAGVSASTLYIYYENKEDMFLNVYLEVKSRMMAASSQGVENNKDVRLSVRKICENLLNFMKQHNDYFLFIEQSSNAPLISEISPDELFLMGKDIYDVFEQGVRQGVLKNCSSVLLLAFCFYPITQIYKESCKQQDMFGDLEFDKIFDMCWDGIKK